MADSQMEVEKSAAEVSPPSLDPSILEKVTDELVRQLLAKEGATRKKIMRELEEILQIPEGSLDSFKNEIKEKIEKEIELSVAAKEGSSEAGAKPEESSKKNDEKGKKKKKRSGDDGDDKKKKQKTDVEEEEEEKNEYEYDDFVVAEASEDEASDSSSSSSSSSSSGGAGGKRRLVQGDDELDEDDVLLLQENAEEQSQAKKDKIIHSSSDSEEEQEFDSKPNRNMFDEEEGIEEEPTEVLRPEYGDASEDKFEGEMEEEEQVLSSGVSSGEEDSDEMEGFIVDDDLPPGPEGHRERRRRRRLRRAKRRENRAALGQGLINLGDIPQENQQLFADCFSIENFDLYLEEEEEDAVDSAVRTLDRLAPDEVRRRYELPEDRRICETDIPERILLVGKKIPQEVNVDIEEQMEMQVRWVSEKVDEDPSICRKCLILFQKECKEVTFVHVYCADITDGLSLKKLWKIFDAGLEYQVIFKKLREVISFIKLKLSSTEVFEEEGENEPFWEEVLLEMFQDGTEEAERIKNNQREGWLRRLNEMRYELTLDLLNDVSAYLGAFLFEPKKIRAKSKDALVRMENDAATRSFHMKSYLEQLGSPSLLGKAVEGDGYGRIQFPSVTNRQSPEDWAMEVVQLDFDPLKLSSNLMAREPRIRKKVRNVFLAHAKISTNRTLRGEKAIVDSSHAFYSVCNIIDKPVTEYFKAFTEIESMSYREEGEDKDWIHYKNAEQVLLMEMASRQGLIEIRVNNDEIGESLLNLLKRSYLREEEDDGLGWEPLRNACLRQAVKIDLIGYGKEFILREISKNAQKSLIGRCGIQFTKRIAVSPFSFDSYVTDPDQLRTKISSELTADKTIFAGIFMSDDPKLSPSFYVALNGDGTEKYRQVLENQNLDDTIESCIKESQPHVVVVNGCPKAKQIVAVLERLSKRLHDVYLSKKKEESLWKGWFAVLVTKDDVISAFSSCDRGKNEFPKDHINFRRAVGLARFQQNPLTIFTDLINDSSLTELKQRSKEPLLNLIFHPLQDELSPNSLLDEYERRLLDVVALTGVELNACVKHEHKSSILNFVPGLGFRKAQYLLKKLRMKRVLYKSRGEVQKVLGSKVFECCAGFLKIPRDVDADIEEEEEEDDDEDMEHEDDDEDEEEEEPEEDEELGEEPKDPSEFRKKKKHSTKSNVPRIRRTCLDGTRIHPADFQLATEICERYCILIQRGETGERATAFVMKKLKTSHHPEFLFNRQKRLFLHFMKEHTIHIEPEEANQGLVDKMSAIGNEFCGRDGNYQDRIMSVLFIIEELRFPFGDRRHPFEKPNEKDLFFMYSGEHVDGLSQGSEINIQVESVPQMFLNEGRFGMGKFIQGKLSSGLRVQLNYEKDLASENDERVKSLKNVVYAMRSARNEFEARDYADDFLKKLQTNFGIFEGTSIEAIVDKVDFDKMRVQAKLKVSTTAVDQILGSLDDDNVVTESSSTWDRYFQPVNFVSETIRTQKPQSETLRRRTISHPIYKHMTEKEAIDYLMNKNVGDSVLRPSSRGLSVINLTWKWSKDPPKFETIPIEELNSSGAPKDPNDPSIGERLKMKNRDYDDIDEILAKYIEPIGQRIRDLQSYKYYKPSSIEEVEGLIRDQRLQNPQAIPYSFCVHSKEPRTFYLVFQDSHDPHNPPKRFRVVARPDGLELIHKSFQTTKQLVDYFKKHLKELKDSNMRKPPTKSRFEPIAAPPSSFAYGNIAAQPLIAHQVVPPVGQLYGSAPAYNRQPPPSNNNNTNMRRDHRPTQVRYE